MYKFFLRFFIFFIVVIVLFTVYLSYFGIETNRFNSLIKNRANEVNKHVQLEFQKTKIHLNPVELNLVLKLKEPKILIKNNSINLSKLDLFLSIKSFFSSDFLLKKTLIAFENNEIGDLTKITNIFIPRIINKRLNKIFTQGNLGGEFIIPFNADGSVGKNYSFSGKIINAKINISKELVFKNLNTDITHSAKDGFSAIFKKGDILDLDLSGSLIKLKNNNNITEVNSQIHTAGKINYSQIKKISSLFNLKISNLNNLNGSIDLKTNIDFNVDKKFKIKNLLYSTSGNVLEADLEVKDLKNIKQYLPKYQAKIKIKDTQIKFTKSKSGHKINTNGLIKLENDFDNFDLNETYDHNKKLLTINGNISLLNTTVKFSKLNYSKSSGDKSELSFDINFIFNKFYNIKNLRYIAEKNKIYLSHIELNNKFELLDFKKIEVKTFFNKIKNNDFVVEKSKKIVVSGNIFDSEPLLKSLFKKSDKKVFSKKFNSEIKVNFEKLLTGTKDEVSNFGMIALINKGSYEKLSLKGDYSENEIVEMSIYKIDDNKKTLQVISDRARPFIKNFDFVKGFEGGKLEYESTITKEESKSNLILTDFKVSKVPALAQLLTLASLQGIADTLNGEGIRFDSFEMKSNTKGNLMNIEDALAMGPAVSILLNGYVDKGNVVSLRGTLVPATKLNSIIASIPLVGDILVGKKTGEGVVGVSFKMKGPPKDIKTTVNPIKTLTPRFIVRAIEKMKKKKKEEAR